MKLLLIDENGKLYKNVIVATEEFFGTRIRHEVRHGVYITHTHNWVRPSKDFHTYLGDALLIIIQEEELW